MKMGRLSFVSAIVLVALGSIPATSASAGKPLNARSTPPARSVLNAQDTAGSWTATQSMSVARSSLTATPLGTGSILVVGGAGESSTELYDPATGTWLPGGTLNQPRWLHAAVRLA